jgi:cytochrome c peroxidase
MIVPTDTVVEDLVAYLISLRPDPNPHLGSGGNLTDAAERGKTLFNDKARCAGCHPAPLFTDKKMHNINVLSRSEPDGRYDTPSLIEGHRTSPYLHDGRAVTLKQVFTDHDKQGRHGKTNLLTDVELDDLVAFLRSL